MTHTLDSEVSLHSWLIWPTVWQLCHGRSAMAAMRWQLSIGIIIVIDMLWWHCYDIYTLAALLWRLCFGGYTLAAMLWRQSCHGNKLQKATDILIHITITTFIVITTVTTITIIYSCLQPIQRFNATPKKLDFYPGFVS